MKSVFKKLCVYSGKMCDCECVRIDNEASNYLEFLPQHAKILILSYRGWRICFYFLSVCSHLSGSEIVHAITHFPFCNI